MHPRRRTSFRRILLVLALFAVLGPIPVALVTCVGPPSYYAEKFAPPPGPHDPPTPLPGPLLPERQIEPHTCGYHSLSTIYRAYGITPDRVNLRLRCGVDMPAVVLKSDTTGTIHPDIVRVLAQDGFDAHILRPSSQDTLDRARAHMAAGHPIMLLTRTEQVGDQGGGLHWVVVAGQAGSDAANVQVIDSLADEPYERPAPEYLTQTALSLILIRPAAHD